MLEVGKWKDKFEEAVEQSKRDLEDERVRSEQTIKR